MKESIWGYWIVVLGISVISVMVLLQNYTTTSEQDYYLVKNCLEAAMYDAVDYGYYRDTGTLKMNGEKFTENFLRRFAQSVNITKDYNVDIYGLYEIPPAASISITTITDETTFGQDAGTTENVNVTNRLTGVLYTNENLNGFNSSSSGSKTESKETFTGQKTSTNGYFIADYTKDLVTGCVITAKGTKYIKDKALSMVGKSSDEYDVEFTVPKDCCEHISCNITAKGYNIVDGKKVDANKTIKVLAEGFIVNDGKK